LRALVAETLKDYGLQRIQYSAFIGDLRHDELNSLLVDLKNLIKDLTENVQLYPLCDTEKRWENPKSMNLKREKRK